VAEPLDGRADLYALGATLYHLATGRPPHQGATTWVVLGAVISEPFPDVLALRSDLGSGFGAVISKLGAKPKGERYADAGQLLDDLALVTAGRAPVHARYRSSVELLASAPPPAGPTVLLIDDDPLVRRIYSTGLGGRGLICVVASDGTTGLDIAGRLRPAVAVVDLVLPDIAGTDVVRLLHAQQPDLPIVVLSNAFAVDQLAAARAAGASRVLPKAATPPSRLADELFTLLRRPVVVGPAAPVVAPAEALSAADAALARMQVLVRRLGSGDESMLLVELAAAAHGFAAAVGAAGATSAATLGAATETLVRELIAQPDRRSASSRRTLAQAATALHGLILAPSCSLTGVRALAVDDDRMARTLLGAALDRVAVRHDIVGSPEEALAKLAGGRYHLLLTDVVMDHLSGFQLAARVRAMPGCAHLPIIFVTGLDDFTAFFAAGEGTGTDLIAKPYLLIELGVKSLVLLATRRS
jgi:CheY-like chemotaxis protein